MRAVGFLRIGMLLCFAATACASASGDRSNDTTSRTFRSPTYGYAIDRDTDWTVVEATRRLRDGEPPATASGATDILGRGASTHVSKMTPPGVIIAAQPVPPGVDARQWASKVVGTVFFMKQCRRPDVQENIRVGGDDAVLLTYERCPEASGFLHFWVAVVHAGFGYHIIWFVEPGRTAKDRPALFWMLSSVSFARGPGG
jgi:hypothetical protein